MKYAAQGESRVANIARGEAKRYICHETLTKSFILLYIWSGCALKAKYFDCEFCIIYLYDDHFLQTEELKPS